MATLFALPVLVVLGASGDLTNGAGDSVPSAKARADIPPDYLSLYRAAGSRYEVDWAVLASVGAQESDHGRSLLPGVRSGVNGYGCCAGPMQFDVTDQGGNTWAAYGVDGNGDGRIDVYDPSDAIPAAARYLADLGATTPDGVRDALVRYSGGSQGYADAVLRRAELYRGALSSGSSSALAPAGADASPEHGGDGRAPVGVADFVFPVRGAGGQPVGSFTDDYASPRAGGGQCGNHPGWHCATDVFAPRGTAVVAPIAGHLERVGWNAFGGWRLWVSNGEDRFYLAHLSGYTAGVADDVEVEAGQVIGSVGNTGSARGTAPHLHVAWEHGPDRVNTDPYFLLAATGPSM